MATLEFITKDDLEQFKQELFAELRRPTFRAPLKKEQQKQWLKSHEVRQLLGVSPGTLQNLRRNGTLRFSKIGGLMFYQYDDVEKLVIGDRQL